MKRIGATGRNKEILRAGSVVVLHKAAGRQGEATVHVYAGKACRVSVIDPNLSATGLILHDVQ